MSEKQFDKKPQELIAEVLSRYSALDLRELSDADLDRADALLAKRDERPEVLSKGETNLIKWWKIRSGDKEYEVRRFENFVFCSCLDFFFSKSACRHIFITTNDFRRKANKEADSAPYLKPTSGNKTERIGNVRI